MYIHWRQKRDKNFKKNKKNLKNYYAAALRQFKQKSLSEHKVLLVVEAPQAQHFDLPQRKIWHTDNFLQDKTLKFHIQIC